MLINRQTSFSGNIVQLCRFFRSKGYGITTTEEVDAMTALTVIRPDDEYLYWSTLRAVFSKNKFQFNNFHDYYKEYIYQLKKAVDSKTKNLPAQSQKPQQSKKPSLDALKDWLFNRPSNEQLDMSSFSDVEVLTKKDFVHMDEDEINLVVQLLAKLSDRILRKKSRLKKKSRRKSSIDLRMTVRKSARNGFEINDIFYSQPKEKKLKLVLICDVSRSMDLYSRFFIQMIYAFQTSYDKINTFVFSTALHDISEIMSNHSYDKAFEIISERIPEWSGGTKIGQSLQRFCDEHSYRLLDRKTVVMILSDGWDTGDSENMTDAMRHIYKYARRVIWLNPLAGHADFQPEVIGLKSALPYISNLLPAHNLESLKKSLILL